MIEETKKYKWMNPPQFEPAKLIETNYGHYYTTPQGVRYPSPTTVFSRLSPFEKSPIYLKWVSKLARIASVPTADGKPIAKYVSKIAMGNGTTTHALIEKYLHNTPETGTIELLPWAHLQNIKPLLHNIDNIRACEIPLYSNQMRLAGTSDCIAEYNDDLAIIDFKTSNGKKRESDIENYFLQGTAYATMYEELTGEKIKQIAILISCNTGDLQSFVKNPEDYKELLLKKLKEFEEMGGYSQ